MPLHVRRRLYALQQRVAITNREASALLVVLTILLVGSILQWVGLSEVVVDPATYAELDAAVAIGARTPIPLAEPEVVRGQVESAGAAHGGGSTRTSGRLPPVRLDPNTASSTLLQRLPGIGPSLAERIIEYRDQVGTFEQARDLTRVRGIGARTLERFEAYIHIETTAALEAAAETDQASGGSTEGALGEGLVPLVP